MALASFLQGQVRVTRIDEHHVAFSIIKIAGVFANAHGNPHQQSSHKIRPGYRTARDFLEVDSGLQTAAVALPQIAPIEASWK